MSVQSKTYADVTVVVPVYNRATTVIATLSSILQQALPPQKLIVVDDGSTDETCKSVQEWADLKHLPFQFQLLTKNNGGPSTARNYGLVNCEDTAFVAFLDSDDRWPPDFLQRACGALELHPNAVAATSDRNYIGPCGSLGLSVSMRPVAQNATLWILKTGAGIGSSSVLRRDVIAELGGFDESLCTGEDAALYLRLSLLGQWLHLPGEPVLASHQTALLHDEESNLSSAFTDNERRWAIIYEDFLRESGWRAHRRAVSKCLSRTWYKAGRELVKSGKTADGIQCFRRALHWRPASFRVWRQMVQYRLQSIRGGRA